MANEQKLTAQQRAVLFGASTRQHMQMLGMKEVTGGAQTISWRVPKSRIMQGLKLYVEGTITTKASAAKDLGKLDIYKVIRRLSVDFNNGFMPVVVSAEEMAMVNMLYPLPEMVLAATDNSTLCKCPAQLAASTGGSDTSFVFMLDVPLTLNYRDPVGLVLAQNAETNIDINVDIANPNAVVNAASGYDCTFKSLKITPEITSFSIPSDSRAFPDMSVLKIVDSRNEAFTAGQSYIKLPVGMIYRKLIFKFEDTEGVAFADSDITSNIELVFNTADVPYSVKPELLRMENKRMSGVDFPAGCFYFSFDYQGVNGYGGLTEKVA